MTRARRVRLSETNYNHKSIARVVIQASGFVFLLAVLAEAQNVENHNHQPQSSRTGDGNGWADVLIATLATDGSFSTSKQNQSAPNYYTLSSDTNNDNGVSIKSLASDNAKNETTHSPDRQPAQEQDDYTSNNSNGSSDDLNLNIVDAAQDRLHAMTSLLNAASAPEDLSDGSIELAPRSGEQKSSFTPLDTGKPFLKFLAHPADR